MRFTKQKKSELKGYRLHNSIGGKTVGTENKLVVARGMGEEALATTEGTHGKLRGERLFCGELEWLTHGSMHWTKSTELYVTRREVSCM